MKILDIGTYVVTTGEGESAVTQTFENEVKLFGVDKYVSGLDYVRSKIIQKLSVIRGELASPLPSYEESATYGIPYLSKLTKAGNDLVISNAITTIPEVQSILKWSSGLRTADPGKPNERKVYYCDFTVLTTEGELAWQI